MLARSLQLGQLDPCQYVSSSSVSENGSSSSSSDDVTLRLVFRNNFSGVFGDCLRGTWRFWVEADTFRRRCSSFAVESVFLQIPDFRKLITLADEAIMECNVDSVVGELYSF